MSRFFASKSSHIISSACKRQFNNAALKIATPKQVSSNYSYPVETAELQDNDVVVSTFDQFAVPEIEYSLDCVQGCRKADNVSVLGYKTRFFFQNSTPLQMDSMNNHNIKKIVCYRDPKSAALSFFESKKKLLYVNGEHNEVDKKRCISNYLFSESFGYTPYSFIVQWYQYLNDNPHNNDVLLLFYEDIISNKKETVTMIADYLNIEIDDQLVDIVHNMSNVHNENKIQESDNVLDDDLNEECDNYWREYIGYHIGNKYIDYDWFRFLCNNWNR